MALNIPMPKSFSDSFNEGYNTSQNMISNLMHNRNQQAQLAETAKYHQGQLGVQKEHLGIAHQAEARAQQLLPHLLQHYKDIHGKAASEAEMQYMQNALRKKAYEDALGGDNQVPQLPGSQQTQNPVAANNPMPGNFNALKNFINRNPEQTQQSNAPQENEEQSPNIAAPEMTNLSGSPEEAQNQQLPAGMQRLTAPQAEQPPQEMPQQSKMNGEQIINPGNPAMYGIDKIAQLDPKSGYKITQHFDPKSGRIISIHPSGKITSIPMGASGEKTVSQETPKEREEREVSTANKKGQSKESLKLLVPATALHSTITRAQKLLKLLKENPGLTGLGTGLSSTLNLSDNPKVAEFDETAKKLQADMGRYASQRGGAQALKWAERAKPGLYRQSGYNEGMLKSIIEDAREDYNAMNNEFSSLTGGKDLPIKINFPEEKKNENSPSKITKEHVTEENILHTMKQTGKSRDEVMARLKQKGLI